MAFQHSTRDFMNTQLPRHLKTDAPLRELEGVVEFKISGEQGGTWYVNLDTGEISTKLKSPQCFVQAHDIDFMALLEGRMSAADGVATGRLKVNGEAVLLASLLERLSNLVR